jgi:hypothetical protein
VAVGKFVAERAPTVLVQHRQTPEGAWQRVPPGDPVWTTDRLVSLPGYASELRLSSGVHLLLRGQVREFSLNEVMDYLLDSAVVLHQTKDFDADLTLQRGRLYLSNHKEKGPAKVRLRFDREVWDLTLDEPGTEVGVDLLRLYTRDIEYHRGEEPRADLFLCVLRGKAGVKIDTYHFSNLQEPPGPSLFVWDNKGSGWRGPIKLDRALPEFNKQPPATPLAKEMAVALQELSLRMVGKQRPEVILLEGREKEQPMGRLLAIYSLCALDEVGKLIEILGDETEAHSPDREAAIFALRRWLSRGPEQGRQLYDTDTRAGLLTATLKYRSGDAKKIFELLHDFKDGERNDPATFRALAEYLHDQHVAIAELAWWHLQRLAQGVKLPRFNAASPRDLREKACAEVLKLVEEGKLPPRPPPPPPAPKPGP